jgi:long-chain acyl-CoA synthetase
MAAMHAGASVTFLHQKPSPKVLQDAFAAVRPTIVFAVPLIIEKIYRKKVLPRIQGRLLLRTMTRVPLLRRVVLRKAVAGLMQAFGGQIKFMGFGGAALPADVERFLRVGGFPYAVGYGMTECSPLISGSSVAQTRAGSCGTPVAGIELRIADPDPATGIGEVQVRGPMVTQGYFRNPEATSALFTPDGFLHTGDLGVQDNDGFVYLKGRSKNLILGPSGENIYPEEIEYLLGRSPSVVECIVVKREGGLQALIYPDYDLLRRELKLHDLSDPQITAAIGNHFKALVAEVNTRLSAYSRLSGFRLVDQEFDKTPTEKIKRHLYE